MHLLKLVKIGFYVESDCRGLTAHTTVESLKKLNILQICYIDTKLIAKYDLPVDSNGRSHWQICRGQVEINTLHAPFL